MQSDCRANRGGGMGRERMGRAPHKIFAGRAAFGGKRPCNPQADCIARRHFYAVAKPCEDSQTFNLVIAVAAVQNVQIQVQLGRGEFVKYLRISGHLVTQVLAEC